MKTKKIVISVVLIVVLLSGILVLVPALFPGFAAKIADSIRSVAGPEPVAVLESVSAEAQDQVNKVVEKGPGLNVVQNTNVAETAPKPEVPVTNVVTASPAIGWTAYGPLVDGVPAMAQALLAPDPGRSYAAIVLVRIDLTKVDLHMVPGTWDPSHSAKILNALPNVGVIAQEDKNRVVAAFNGGFKADNGDYGMMVDNIMLSLPKQGIETIVQFSDMSLRMENWGEDPGKRPIISFRQNCPPLLDNGEIPPEVNKDSAKMWGYTVGNDIVTWRSALGITKDRRYLIYAVGNATSVAMLAQTLKDAGAYNAMQLDINKYYVSFVTFETVNGSPSAVRLLTQMQGNSRSFLVPRDRDFFYLTVR